VFEGFSEAVQLIFEVMLKESLLPVGPFKVILETLDLNSGLGVWVGLLSLFFPQEYSMDIIKTIITILINSIFKTGIYLFCQITNSFHIVISLTSVI
jgi:hypothetical protein